MNILIPSLIVVHVLFFFLGFRYGWSVFQYDELRLVQLLITIVSIIYIIRSGKIHFSLLSCIILVIIFLQILINYNKLDFYSKQDILLLNSIFFIFYSLKISFEENSNKMKIIIPTLFFSLFPTIFIFLSIYNLISLGDWFDWQLNGGSVRIFDSAIVPIYYFILYYFYKNPKANWLLILVFLISLSLFFDGARSAIISCILPIIFLFIVSKENRILASKTLIVFFMGFIAHYLTFFLYNIIYNVQVSLFVARSSTSSRLELWKFAYFEWLKTPFSGAGGGFLSGLNSINVNHLHNFYLKILFEWGIAGFLILILILKKKAEYLLGNNNLILKMGITGVAIDAFFSGNLIYPGSFFSCILFLGFAFSTAIDHKIHQWQFLSKLIFSLFASLFLYIIFFEFYNDFTCWGCGSYEGREAPGFWYYGATKHLVPAEQIP